MSRRVSHPECTPNYDYIAFAYDFLARIVFGNTLWEAQTDLMDHIPEGASILWIGGGTGKVLKGLKAQKPSHISYVEASAQMLKRTKQRVNKLKMEDCMELIQGTQADIPSGRLYDVVFTGFFLDQFPQAEMEAISKTLSSHLKPNGIWLHVDFERTEGVLQVKREILLWVMFTFFYLTTGVRSFDLPDYTSFFKQHKYQLEKRENPWNGGMIFAEIWRKSSD